MAEPNQNDGAALAQATLDAIVDAMADPLFVKDDEHRFILVNRALCEMLGFSREQLIGKTDFDLFPQEQAAVFRAKDEEVLRDGGVNINREQITGSDGETRVIVTKKTVCSSDARRILIGTIRDVTEQHLAELALRRAHDELERRVHERTREIEEAEAQLRRSQRLETIGQLTGGLAHDFNNLLTVVIGNLDLLGIGDFDHEGSRRLLDEAFGAATRSAELVQHLLAYSRQQVLRAQLTDVAALFERMLPLIRRSLGEAVVVDLRKPDAPLFAEIDGTRLETAVLNLAINARDAILGHGRLEFELSCLELDGGAWILIEARDNGTGMPPDVVERAFDPFFTTKGNRGSGLGLSMVQGFVEQSGGHISVISVPGSGTCFQIYLPRATARNVAQAPAPQPPADAPVGGSERILIVEDDPIVRRYVGRAASSLGYEVLEAGTLDAAYAIVRTKPGIALLLSDVVLGDGRVGPSFADAVVAEQPCCRVLLMSGYAPETLGPALGWPVLRKPFVMRALAAAIREALDGRD